jgi:hypothetical protein
VIRLTRHARALLVALAVLALSAGAAFAGRADPAAGSMPDAAAAGLDRAAAASGQTVPAAGADREANEADEDADQDEDTAENEPAEDESGAPAEHPDNHGADVSAAAQAATPQAFTNHGQYVRSVATANHGQETSAQQGNATSQAARGKH